MPLTLHQQTRQTQTQTQTLTPQMQQGLEILQAPMVELRQKIRQEIEELNLKRQQQKLSSGR